MERFEFHVTMLEESAKEMEDERRSRCWLQRKSCHRLWRWWMSWKSRINSTRRSWSSVCPCCTPIRRGTLELRGVSPERISERIVEEIDGVAVPHIKKEIVEVPVEVLGLDVMKELVGVPLPQVTEEFVGEPVPHMKEGDRRGVRRCDRCAGAAHHEDDLLSKSGTVTSSAYSSRS